MPKISDVAALGGIIPAAAAGAFGDENKGFALGLVPGMMYRNRKRKEGDTTSDTSTQPGGMKKGGKVSSASARADGCAIRGKTRGKIV